MDVDNWDNVMAARTLPLAPELFNVGRAQHHVMSLPQTHYATDRNPAEACCQKIVYRDTHAVQMTICVVCWASMLGCITLAMTACAVSLAYCL